MVSKIEIYKQTLTNFAVKVKKIGFKVVSLY